MTCSDFIEGFSDYVDGRADPATADAARRHLDACASCRRYEEVYLRGRELLRAHAAGIELPEDFRPRLQHRLYHVDDERALARTSRSSAFSALGLVAAAAVVMAAAWTPDLFGEPEVELSPIVVNRPAPRPLGLRAPLPRLLPADATPAVLYLGGDDLWRHPSALLYEYAPVRARYRRAGALAGAGLD